MTETHQHSEPGQSADPAAPRGTGIVLQISSSPRSTWLWAPDEAAVEAVRAVVGWGSVQHRGQELPLVMDIDIGVMALETCERLAAAGFTFTWHESEHPLNRDNWPSQLPGMPEQPQTAR